MTRWLTRRSLLLGALLSAAALILPATVPSSNHQRTVSVTYRLNQGNTGGQGGSLALPARVDNGKNAGTGAESGAPAPSRPSPTDPNHGNASDPNTPDVPTPDPSTPPVLTPDPLAVLHNTGRPQVALTFDDGPDGATPQILALLRQHRVKATFCVIGVNIHSNEDKLRQIVADGHTLCNHTWSHDLRLGTRNPEVIRSDLQRTNDEIHRVVPGAPIRYFRHPGGNFTAAAVAISRELGMTSISWDVDPRDWEVKRYGSGGGMTNHIVNTVTSATRPGSIVLSHDGGGPRAATVAAYTALLPWLLDRYELFALPV